MNVGILFTDSFKGILNNPLRSIKLSKFKMSYQKQIWESLGGIDLNYVLTRVQSVPQDSMTGEAVFYEFDSCIKDSLFTISFGIPDYDVSLDDYNTIYLFYDDILTGETELAGIIYGFEYDIEEECNVPKSLKIEPDRTIINLSGFKPKCHVSIKQGTDLSFLEGTGFGELANLYQVNHQEDDIRYVSRVSYEAYLQEKRNEDECDHLYTTFINKYGLKIY